MGVEKPSPDGLLHDKPARDAYLHHHAHDLKNRLTALWEAYRMMRDVDDPAMLEELNALAERSFFGGLRCVEQLMDDMQVDRDGSRGRMEQVDLVPLLTGAVDSLVFRTEKKGQHVDLDLPTTLVVQGDTTLLGMLFEALLSNAIKFSPRAARIAVQARTEGNHADIRIVDEGVGLAQQDIDRIFHRYVILGSRTTDGEMQNRSTLARALRWAQAHGGTITYTSAGPGKGTTCSLRLPLGSQ